MRRAAAIVYLMSLSATAGDVYRSVDSQGHVQYSDTPSPGAELVHGQSTRTPPPTPPVQSTAKPSDPKAPSTQAMTDAQHAVQNDLEQTRADQCKKAQDSYQQAIQARRIYKPAADGSREYLSDDDADQVRLNARLEVDAACKGG